jgi:hypothetical protein
MGPDRECRSSADDHPCLYRRWLSQYNVRRCYRALSFRRIQEARNEQAGGKPHRRGLVILLLMVAVLIDSCHTISTLDLYDEPH